LAENEKREKEKAEEKTAGEKEAAAVIESDKKARKKRIEMMKGVRRAQTVKDWFSVQ
jgi:hypothetical protein